MQKVLDQLSQLFEGKVSTLTGIRIKQEGYADAFATVAKEIDKKEFTVGQYQYQWPTVSLPLDLTPRPAPSRSDPLISPELPSKITPQPPPKAPKVQEKIAAGDGVQIVLYEGFQNKESFSETVDVLQGIVAEFKKMRTIKHVMTFGEADAVVKTTLAKNKNSLTALVKTSVERELGQKLEETETTETTVRLDGNKIQHARLYWVEKCKSGVMEVTVAGTVHKVPFDLPISTTLLIKPVKSGE
jgi:hypothetical protein